MRKIPSLHLISWCENFVDKHSVRIVLGNSPETMRKLCVATKFPHQEISWKYGIFGSASNKSGVQNKENKEIMEAREII